ncbi:MAG: PIN domain-containing protein [Nitrospinota bacterium]|nr:PIN domain-containing protein [Nitrospinota bacterium]
MIYLVIDSSEIISGTLFSPSIFNALKTLTQNQEIKIHLPYVVYREVTTSIQNSCRSTIKDFQKLVKKSENILRLSPSIKREFDLWVNNSNKISNYNDQKYVKDFDDLIAELNITVSKTSTAYADDVIAAYFNGSPPFKSIKNRADFPDAFIWYFLEELKGKVYGDLVFISRDKPFREMVDNNGEGTIMVFDTLKAFLGNKNCQDILKKIDELPYYQNILNFLKQNDSILNDKVTNLSLSELAWMEIHSPLIPNDNNDALISMIPDPINIEIDTTNANYFGNGLLSIPITFDMPETLVDYTLLKSQFYTLSDEKVEKISVSDDQMEHIIEVQEYFDINVASDISLKVDIEEVKKRKPNEANIRDIIERAELKFEGILDLDIIG